MAEPSVLHFTVLVQTGLLPKAVVNLVCRLHCKRQHWCVGCLVETGLPEMDPLLDVLDCWPQVPDLPDMDWLMENCLANEDADSSDDCMSDASTLPLDWTPVYSYTGKQVLIHVKAFLPYENMVHVCKEFWIRNDWVLALPEEEGYMYNDAPDEGGAWSAQYIPDIGWILKD